jgi:hypothetical protein
MPLRRLLAAVAVTLAVAVAAGALTPFGQQYLPEEVSSVANASGSWTMVALLAVYLSRARGVLAAVLGVAALLALNETYGAVSSARGYPYSAGLDSMWTYIAIVAGPLVGLCASWLRSASPRLVAVAVAVPSAVLVGEGLYGLIQVADTTSPVYWWIEIAGGVAFVAVVPVRMLRTPTLIAGAGALTLAGGVLYYAVYTTVLPAVFSGL